MYIAGETTFNFDVERDDAKYRWQNSLFRDSNENSRDGAQLMVGMFDGDGKLISRSKCSFGSSLGATTYSGGFKTNLNLLGMPIHKIVICLDRPGHEGIAPLKAIAFSCEEHASCCEPEFFDLLGQAHSKSAVLTVLSREGERWWVETPGVALPYLSEDWMDEGEWTTTACKRVWASLSQSLPNALSPEILHNQFDLETVTHFLKYSDPGLLGKIYAAGKAFQFRPEVVSNTAVKGDDPMVLTLKEYATHMFLSVWNTWPDNSLNAGRKNLLRGLLADGADWIQAFNDLPGDSDAHPISRLQCRAFERRNWVAVMLALMPKNTVLEYVISTEKANAMYHINPMRYLIPHIGEELRVSTLEEDLGL
jgi:hypothetical protein